MKIFQLWTVLNSCIFMSCYFMAFLLLKYSKLQSFIICTTSILLSTILELCRIHYFYDSLWAKIVVTVANILIMQSTALILSNKKDSYALFIGFGSSNFVLAGNLAACAVFLLFEGTSYALITCVCTNSVVFVCIYLMIGKISKTLLSKEISIWMCLIPALFYVTFYLLLYFPVSFEENPENMYVAGSLLFTVVVMYVLLIRYIHTKSEETKLMINNQGLFAYIRGIELQIDATESAIRKFQIMRHDMRHKDHLLIELLHDQKYQEAEKLLQKDIEYLDQTHYIIYCENTVLNSILCNMVKRAHNQDTQLSISCAVPKKQNIDDYDLAILTANLLENALQAVAKLEKSQRNVTFTLKTVTTKNFFLEILNPCNEQVHFSKKTGLPLSNQEGEHGYGMLSVQEFVKKYHAHLDCYLENQIFTVRILF